MSEQDVKPVSSATGVFAAPQADFARSNATGNSEPQDGKNVPAENKKSPDMEQLAQSLNVSSRSIGRDLRFEVDMESGRSVIQVLDRDTGELIRQIPPEKTSLYLLEAGSVALRLYDDSI